MVKCPDYYFQKEEIQVFLLHFSFQTGKLLCQVWPNRGVAEITSEITSNFLKPN